MEGWAILLQANNWLTPLETALPQLPHKAKDFLKAPPGKYPLKIKSKHYVNNLGAPATLSCEPSFRGGWRGGRPEGKMINAWPEWIVGTTGNVVLEFCFPGGEHQDLLSQILLLLAPVNTYGTVCLLLHITEHWHNYQFNQTLQTFCRISVKHFGSGQTRIWNDFLNFFKLSILKQNFYQQPFCLTNCFQRKPY